MRLIFYSFHKDLILNKFRLKSIYALSLDFTILSQGLSYLFYYDYLKYLEDMNDFVSYCSWFGLGIHEIEMPLGSSKVHFV